MLSRRSVVFAAVAASAALVAPAFATETQDVRSGILRGGAEGRQADLRRDPRLLVSDLQGAETDPERADVGAEVQGSRLFRHRFRHPEGRGEILRRTHAIDADRVQGPNGNRPLGRRHRAFLDRRAPEQDALSD